MGKNFICGSKWLYRIENDIVLVFKSGRLIKTMEVPKLKYLMEIGFVKPVKV
jgi:hypothetical protein